MPHSTHPPDPLADLSVAFALVSRNDQAHMRRFLHNLKRGVRTNNYVERANRRLRFWQKLRYQWPRGKWVLRFVLLALDRWWQQAATAAAEAEQAAQGQPQQQPAPAKAAG